VGVGIYVQVPEHNGEQSKPKRGELQDPEGSGWGTSEGHELRPTEIFLLRQSAKSHRAQTRIHFICVHLAPLWAVAQGAACLLL